jgi:hypothetical protein
MVAELCHRCRDIRAATVSELVQYHHVYFIPVGSKKSMGFEIVCSGCRCTILAKEHPYIGFVPKDPGDIGALVEMTNPGAVERLQARIELDERIASGTASREDRITAINEAFMAMGLPHQVRLHGIFPTTALCLIGVPVFGAAWAIAANVPPKPDPSLVYSLAIGMFLSLICFIYSATTVKGRFVRRKILPALAAELAPIRPDVGELAESREVLKKNKLSLANYVRPEALVAAIQADHPGTSPLTPVVERRA